MKLAVLGDIHFCCRNGNEHIQNNIGKFIDDVLLPELKKRNIKNIIQTGDLYDNRKSNSNIGVNYSKEKFFDVLEEEGIHFDTLIGNHDMMYLHDTTKNTPALYLVEYDNVRIFDKPTTVNYNGFNIDFIPWVCDTNKDDILKFIKNTKSKICIGHFEINGFEMSKGHMCENGLGRELFDAYETVLSGHFHGKSKSGNILYVGSPTQTTYGEIDDIKGFHIFDTEDMSIEFIENPHNLYQKVIYNDDYDKKYVPNVSGKYVRILLPQEYDDKKYRDYLDLLQNSSPIEIKATESKSAIVGSDISLADIENASFSMVDFITDYTVNNNEDLDKSDIFEIISEIYTKAITEE